MFIIRSQNSQGIDWISNMVEFVPTWDFYLNWIILIDYYFFAVRYCIIYIKYKNYVDT